MIQDLYRQYDLQRDAADKVDRRLKDAIKTNHRYLQQIHSPEAGAIARLALSKVSLEQARLASAAERPAFLAQADEHLTAALAFYDSAEVREHKRFELAECFVLLARIKIAQGAIHSAQSDLRHALSISKTDGSSCQGELRDNLLAAFAELTDAKIRSGQLADALLDLYPWA